jgi:Kef-type K+ transport system membrane component KefB
VQKPDPQDLKRAGQARTVGVVLAVTMVLWMGAQWLGGQLGLDTRYAFLLDFAAIAAFLWAMVVTYQIWRERRG